MIKEQEYRRDDSQQILPKGFIKTGIDLSREYQGTFVKQTNADGVLKTHIIDLISSSTKTVVLSSFLINDEDIAQALKKKSIDDGIGVYILTAGTVIREDQLDSEDIRSKEMFEQMRNLLRIVEPHCLIRTASYFHPKAIVVDHNYKASNGLLLTCNLNKEPLYKSAELAVALNPAQANALGRFLSYLFWEKSENEFRAGSEYKIDPIGRFTVPENLGGLITPLSIGNENMEETLLNTITAAKGSIKLCSYNWGHPKIESILLEKLKIGCEVKLFVREKRDKQLESLSKLLDAGAKLFEVPLLHAKAVLADQKGIVMTSNLDEASLKTSVEIGLVLNAQQVLELESILEKWETTCPSYYMDSMQIGDYLGEYEILNSGGRKPLMVVERLYEELPSIVADCASNLDVENKPDLPAFTFNGKSRIGKETVFKRRIEAPSLSKKAKPLKPQEGEAPYPLPTFKVKDKIHVGITDQRQLDAAIKFKSEIGATKIVWVGNK